MGAKIDKSLVLKMVGDQTELSGMFSQVKKEIDGVSKALQKGNLDIKKMAEVGGAASLAVIAAFTAITIKTSETVSGFNDLADQTGVNVESLQKLGYAAQKEGINMEGLSGLMAKMQKNMVEADRGSTSAKNAFNQLGVSIYDNNGKLKTADKMFMDVSESIKQMGDGNKTTVAAMDIFGKTAYSQMGFLKMGREELTKYAKEAEQLGLVMSGETIDAAEELTKKLDAAKAGLAGFGNTITQACLPGVDLFVSALVGIEKIINMIPGPIRTTLIAFIALTAVIGAGVAAWTLFGAAAWAALAPMLPFIASAAALAGLATLVYNNWDKVAAWFMNVWDKVKAVVSIAWSGIKLYILGGVYAVAKSIEILMGWIPGWGDKIKGITKQVGDAITEETNNIKKQTESLSTNNYDKYLKEMEKKKKEHDEKQKQQQIETTAEQVKAEKDWADKIFEVNATEIQRLQRERQKELDKEGLTQKARAEIYQYYSLRIQKIMEDENKKKQELQTDWSKKVFDLVADERSKIQYEWRKSVIDAGNNEKAIADINIYYTKLLEKYDEEQLKKKEENAQKELQDKKDLAKEVWALNASELEKLNAEEQERLSNTKLTEEEITQIKLYYAKKRKEIEDQQLEDKKALEKEIWELNATDLMKLNAEEAEKLKNTNLTEEQRTAIVEYYSKKRQELEDQENEKIRQNMLSYVNLASDIFGKMNDIANIYYENEMIRLDNQTAERKAQIEQQFKDGLITEGERDAAIANIEDEAEKRKKKAAREKAERDKQSSLFSIAVETARAAIEALPNLALSILIGVMGAAEYAAVANRPLPKYAKGGIATQETLGVFGEAGPEGVFPLDGPNANVWMNPLADKLAARMINNYNTTNTSNDNRNTQFTFNGVLIGNEEGYRQLANKLTPYLNDEKNRRGEK